MSSHRCANPPTSLPAEMHACFLPPPRLSESFCGPWFRTFGADSGFRTTPGCARIRSVLPLRAEPLGSLGGLAHRPGLQCGRRSSIATSLSDPHILSVALSYSPRGSLTVGSRHRSPSQEPASILGCLQGVIVIRASEDRRGVEDSEELGRVMHGGPRPGESLEGSLEMKWRQGRGGAVGYDMGSGLMGFRISWAFAWRQ